MSNDEFASSVASILRDAGLTPEPGSSWATSGRNPDFFCPGDPPIWVEAKLLERTPEWEAIRRLWDSLRDRARDVPGTGTAHAYVSPNTDEGAVKRALELVGGALEGAAVPRCLVVVHGQVTSRHNSELSYTHGGESVRYISNEPSSERFGIPYGVPPDSWGEYITVHHPVDGNYETPLFQVASENAFLVALDIYPDESAPDPFYGNNGIWHRDQHTSTSAVCWMEDGRPTLTVHNPWASVPLPKGLIGGRELEVDEDDGRLRDCSSEAR